MHCLNDKLISLISPKFRLFHAILMRNSNDIHKDVKTVEFSG